MEGTANSEEDCDSEFRGDVRIDMDQLDRQVAQLSRINSLADNDREEGDRTTSGRASDTGSLSRSEASLASLTDPGREEEEVEDGGTGRGPLKKEQ